MEFPPRQLAKIQQQQQHNSRNLLLKRLTHINNGIKTIKRINIRLIMVLVVVVVVVVVVSFVAEVVGEGCSPTQTFLYNCRFKRVQVPVLSAGYGGRAAL